MNLEVLQIIIALCSSYPTVSILENGATQKTCHNYYFKCIDKAPYSDFANSIQYYMEKHKERL